MLHTCLGEHQPVCWWDPPKRSKNDYPGKCFCMFAITLCGMHHKARSACQIGISEDLLVDAERCPNETTCDEHYYPLKKHNNWLSLLSNKKYAVAMLSNMIKHNFCGSLNCQHC